MTRFNPTERIGVSAVSKITAEEFGWIFREQSVSDVGIDGQIEFVIDGTPQGRLLAAQIKTGRSYLNEAEGGFFYYGDMEHYYYWLNHSLPVLLIIHAPDTKETFWVHVNIKNCTLTKKSWKIFIPKESVFDRTAKAAITKIFNSAPSSTSYNNKTSSAHEWQQKSLLKLVNNTAGNLQLARWYFWISDACWSHIVSLPESFIDGVIAIRASLPGIIFPPGYDEIKISLKNLVSNGSLLVDYFTQRAEYVAPAKVYSGFHAYKRIYPNPNFERDRIDHENWSKKCVTMVHEFAKSANWFADAVRKELDPEFFFDFGKFLIPNGDFDYGSILLTYTDSDKENITAQLKN